MPEQIVVYSLPINKNNIEGRFYNVYLNKNSNLDLTNLVSNTKSNIQFNKTNPTPPNTLKDSILNYNPITPNTEALTKPETLSLLLPDYTKLMQYSKNQREIIETLRKSINDFISNYQQQNQLLEQSLIDQASLFQAISNSTINKKGAR